MTVNTIIETYLNGVDELTEEMAEYAESHRDELIAASHTYKMTESEFNHMSMLLDWALFA